MIKLNSAFTGEENIKSCDHCPCLLWQQAASGDDERRWKSWTDCAPSTQWADGRCNCLQPVEPNRWQHFDLRFGRGYKILLAMKIHLENAWTNASTRKVMSILCLEKYTNLKSENYSNLFNLGTFDVSIVKSHPGKKLLVLAIQGHTHLGQLQINNWKTSRILGGQDFDQGIMEYALEEFKSKGREFPENQPKAMKRLRTACMEAKHKLTFQDKSCKIQVENLGEQTEGNYKLLFHKPTKIVSQSYDLYWFLSFRLNAKASFTPVCSQRKN